MIDDKKSQILLLLPVIIVFSVLFALPLFTILIESFHEYEPGRIGSVEGAPLTIENYMELTHPVYFDYFLQTYAIAFYSTIISIISSFPIAYYIARNCSPGTKKAAISAMVGLLFLSHLVRIYATLLTFGSAGILAPVMSYVGVNTNSSWYIDVTIVAGLLQYTIPISVLVLIGTIQSLNPRLNEAAQSLGASVFTSHLTITLPLCIRGIVGAFLVSMTLGVSAFAIPWILGKGRVLFISNLIYSRFSEVGNLPSGSAVSITMIILAMIMVFLVSRMTSLVDRT
ncbi:MAG: ABC transporter permease subunit [Mesorhizobium sp.]|uniref:ABC transporter permease n=1 Tax=Mesorhizobium sp. TaxID=1871066 RepID=UPI000FEA83F8|nr:ABC transporter permease subunit [Mesorhizobium sp.]RWK46663.1 MAG: ABC transporter permease subunit [Mesorhizobium sp.]